MDILFEIKNNVGIITFDQNDSKVNVLSSGMLRQFDDILNDIQKKYVP